MTKIHPIKLYIDNNNPVSVKKTCAIQQVLLSGCFLTTEAFACFFCLSMLIIISDLE